MRSLPRAAAKPPRKDDMMYVTIKKGFATGKVCRAQRVVEDGQVFYLCRIDGFQMWFTPEYVEVRA